MFKQIRPVQFLVTVRHFATKKDVKKYRSVLKQDPDSIPEYKFQRSKTADRRVYVWGMAATGALGVQQSLKKAISKNAHVVHHPTRQPFAERRGVLDVACGYGFTLFSTEKDKEDEPTLFGCGLNTDAQIGFHKFGGATNQPMEVMIYPAPIQLPKSTQDENEVIDIKLLAAGRAHSVVLAENGTVFTMGNNSYGQCARTIIEGEQYANSQMIHRFDGNTIFNEGTDDDSLADIVCGQDHTLFLTKSGQVYSCGWGADGQTGLSHYNSTGQTERVRGDILTEKIVKVASSVDCVLALNGND